MMSTMEALVSLGAYFRHKDADRAGRGYMILQALVRDGVVEHVSQGLYRRAAVELSENDSLAAVCARAPNSVVCLLSAAVFNE